jgi:mannose/fructose/N-acetylgalactosamine-specific phosphotransferase system component IIB
VILEYKECRVFRDFAVFKVKKAIRVNNNPKPIYEREVWIVMEKVADQLKLAQTHCPIKTMFQCGRHIKAAETIITTYILEDMKRAEQCQRKRG